MREGTKRTPVELLRAVIEEQNCEMPCDTLHELHGDKRNLCNDRDCRECKLDAMRKAADLVEAEIDALKARALPEGMEWPKVDGKPVDFKTGYEPSLGVLEAVSIYSNGACQVMSHDGIIKSAKDIHIVKPKVLDADGVEIREGDVLYSVETGDCVVVGSIEPGNPWFAATDGALQHCAKFTHRAPVLAADGEPLYEGETVYEIETDNEFTVTSISNGATDPDFPNHTILCASSFDSLSHMFEPYHLTHERPDSWERVEADCSKCCIEYCDEHGLLDAACNTAEGDASTRHCTDCGDSCEERMARDLVRRARALAERGR